MKNKVIFIGLLVLAIALSGCTQPSNLQGQFSLNPTGEAQAEPAPSNSIPDYTEPKIVVKEPDLNANWGCVFVVAPEDQEFFSRLEYKVDLACEKAILIQEKLGVPLKPYYPVSFEDDVRFAALYAGDGQLVFTYQGISSPGLQYTIIHEMTHSALEDMPLPIWFEEGLAERMPDIAFNRDTTLVRDVEGIETLDPFFVENILENNINYRYVNYVAKKFTDKYGETALKETLQIMKEKDFSWNIKEQNKDLIEAMREATGDNSITLEEIVYPNG